MKTWWKYIKPYLPYFIIGPACMIIEVIGEILMPKLLGFVVTSGTTAAMEQSLTVSKSILVSVGMIGIALLMMGSGVGGA